MTDANGLIREYAQKPPMVRRVEYLDSRSVANTPFDLQNEDLIRVFVSSTAMLVVISHIICDLTTLKILLNEVADTYLGKYLATITKSYAETTWSTPATPCHLTFWSNYLANMPTL
jgi:hypothetical protein